MFEQHNMQGQNPQPPQTGMPQVGASASQSQVPPATIYTMPEKFMGSTGTLRAIPQAGGAAAPAASGKRLFLTVGIVAVVLGALTTGAYFLLNSSYNPFTSPEPSVNVPPVNEAPVPNENTAPVENTNVVSPNENENNNESAALSARERDQKRLDDLIAIADALDKYFASSGGYPSFLSQLPSSVIEEVPHDPATGQNYVYVAAGDKQSYEIVFEIEESVVFKGETWPRGTYRLKPIDFKTTQAPVDPLPVPPLPVGSIDADGDGLTAAEEALMKTSPQTNDTDADGYPDASEIANFYSPIQSGGVKLSDTGLVRYFSSESLAVSFYYPADWTADANDQTSEILITTQTGENISIQRNENPEGKTAWEWYVSEVSGDLNQNNVKIETIAGVEAVRTLDGLNAYIAINSRVFVVTYHLNNVKTVDYPALFNFILSRLVIN